MLSLQEVETTARNYLGTPYVHQGRTQWGLDCAGLLAIVARDLHIPYRDRTDYPRRPRGNEFYEFIQDQMPDTFREPKPGLVGFFRQGPLVCHCGIFSLYRGQELRVIHAFSPRKKVTEDNFLGTSWERLLVSVRAYPGTV